MCGSNWCHQEKPRRGRTPLGHRDSENQEFCEQEVGEICSENPDTIRAVHLWDRWKSSRFIGVLAIGTHTGKCLWFGVWRSLRLNPYHPSIWDTRRRSEESQDQHIGGFVDAKSLHFRIANPETLKGGRSHSGGAAISTSKSRDSRSRESHGHMHFFIGNP
jgi:hypothetical protein